MNPRQLVEIAQLNQPLPDSIRPYLIGITSKTPDMLVNEIIKYIESDPPSLLECPIDAKALAEVAYEFHQKARTLTSNVESNLALLASGAPRLRMAHQINLFPSMSITGQLILLNVIAKVLNSRYGISSAQIYLALDYDRAEDRRFRVSHFPDAARDGGSLCLTGAVSSRYFNKPMWVVPKPPQELVRNWLNQINYSITENLAILRKKGFYESQRGKMYANFNLMENIVWRAYDQASSLVEFNAYVLSSIVNGEWNLPVAFMLGSKIQPLMKNGYEFIISKYPQILSATLDAYDYLRGQGIILKGKQENLQRTLPIWFVCPNCNERLEACYDGEIDALISYSYCHCCNTEYKFELGTIQQPQLDNMVRSGKITPRIILDNLLDLVSLGVIGGSGYIGQAEHLLITNYVASKLGFVLSPQILYSPKMLYNSLVECRASIVIKENTLGPLFEKALLALRRIYTGRASFLYYIVNFGFKSLCEMWETIILEKSVSTLTSPIVTPHEFHEDLRKIITSIEETGGQDEYH